MSKTNWALLAIPAGLAAYWLSKRANAGEIETIPPDELEGCSPGFDFIDGECVPQGGVELDPIPDPVLEPDPVPDPVPGGQTDAPWDGQLLAEGAEGPLVTALQRVLCFLGHGGKFGNSDAIDRYGPKTKAAVRAFQAAAGISKDGMVGTDTTIALDEACREQGITVGEASQIPCSGGGQANQGEGGGATPEPIVSWGVAGSGISFSPDCLDVQVSTNWIEGTLVPYAEYLIQNIPDAGAGQLATAIIWGGEHGSKFEDVNGIVEAEHPNQNMYQCVQGTIDQLHYWITNTIAGLM